MATRKDPPKPQLVSKARPAPIKRPTLKKTRKLEEITELPEPSPAQLAAAKKANAKIARFRPADVEGFIKGHVTLGELQGISKPEQYEMAKTGWRLMTEGKLDKAIEVFTGLAALDPFDAYFLTALGSAHQQKGQLDEADRFYSRALEINPYSTTARAHRGEVRALLKRPAEAVKDLARAVKEDPQGKDPAVKRARVLLASIAKELEGKKAAPPPPRR